MTSLVYNINQVVIVYSYYREVLVMIKKLDTDKYRITIEQGYDMFGKRKRMVRIFNGSKSEAIKKESELKSKYYHTGDQKNIKDLTFKELGELYLKKNLNNITNSTYCLYEGYLKCINQYIGNNKIKKITTFMLDSLYEELRKGRRSELSNRTLRNYRKFINAIFEQAVCWELIDKNPNEKASKFNNDGKKRPFYSIHEAQQLINALDDEPIKFRTIILLALDSGARKGEICALRWSDIDFDSHVMKISKTLKVINGKPDESGTKTESSKREIVLSNHTIEVLIEYKNWQEEYIKKHKDKWVGKEDRVFTSLNGRFMNPVSCNTALSSVLKRHGLKNIPFHSLRHTSASMLLNSGIDIKTISKRLGHANASMTLNVYTHVLEESKSACASKFDEIVQNS